MPGPVVPGPVVPGPEVPGPAAVLVGVVVGVPPPGPPGGGPSAKRSGVKFRIDCVVFVVWKFPSEQTLKTVLASVTVMVLPDNVVAMNAPLTSLTWM